MQSSSDTIGALAAALAKAQVELRNPEKLLTGTLTSAKAGGGSARTFRYASLSSGLDLVRKGLGAHEIATVQRTELDKEGGCCGSTPCLRIRRANGCHRTGRSAGSARSGTRSRLELPSPTPAAMPHSHWSGSPARTISTHRRCPHYPRPAGTAGRKRQSLRLLLTHTWGMEACQETLVAASVCARPKQGRPTHSLQIARSLRTAMSQAPAPTSLHSSTVSKRPRISAGGLGPRSP
jgi:hypothetical protein